MVKEWAYKVLNTIGENTGNMASRAQVNANTLAISSSGKIFVSKDFDSGAARPLNIDIDAPVTDNIKSFLKMFFLIIL